MGSSHRTHGDVVKRLKRARGHLDAIIGMIDEHRRCPDVLQQMAAVLAALARARRIFLEDHLQSCVADAVRSGDTEAALEELEETLRMVL